MNFRVKSCYARVIIVAAALAAAAPSFAQTQRPSGQKAQAGAKGNASIAQTCRRLSFAITPPGAAKEAVRAAQIESCIRNGGKM